MESVYVFILRNDVWIYIICGLGLFWYVSELFRAQRTLRVAVFGLERERGTARRNNALFFSTLLLLIGSFVFFVNTQIAPTIPAELLKPATSTPDIFRTPLASPTALQTRVPSPTPPLVPTITLASDPGAAVPTPEAEETAVAEATQTPTPGPTPTPIIGCNLDLNILDPRDGTVTSGTIIFTGTADTDNFGVYRLEINGPQTNGEWSSLLGRDIGNTIRDGILGSTNLSQWESGPYLIRLTATDPQLNPTNICVIQITLSN